MADIDTSADELARGFAALLKASRAIPDIAETWRAFDNLHAIARQRKLDAGVDLDRLEPSANDPMVLIARANAIMVRAGVELGLKWQRLLSDSLPDIRRKLDQYRDDEDPYPEDREALRGALINYLQELRLLIVDSGLSLTFDIGELQRQLLPERDPDLTRPR